MPKYRKKPVVIEAIYFDNNLAINHMKATWGKPFKDVCMYMPFSAKMKLKTLEGDHEASYGDYIIKGIANEFYPCKKEIFEQTYELVEE
jgi:hypothetical protein